MSIHFVLWPQHNPIQVPLAKEESAWNHTIPPEIHFAPPTHTPPAPQKKAWTGKDQQQAQARWWKTHTFSSHSEIQERLQQEASTCPYHLTLPDSTPAPPAPHALPRLDEEGLWHEGERHKKKRKESHLENRKPPKTVSSISKTGDLPKTDILDKTADLPTLVEIKILMNK